MLRVFPILFAAVLLTATQSAAFPGPASWQEEWPRTDFGKSSVDLGEIFSGGPPKDGIPSIDEPRFVSVKSVRGLKGYEPVIGVVVNGEARAYPLRVLMWHEIVNDTIAGVPVLVTYCPLCNSAVVFERRIGERVTTFGTTGKLRHSDMVMYDRMTESWWQQFLGEAIVGELTGQSLKAIPSRLESFAEFKARAPKGVVLVPNDEGRRDYGRNPYAFYDSRTVPYEFFSGPFPGYIEPMVRVVVVGDKAWSLPLLREKGRIEDGELVLNWREGQSSALDHPDMTRGREVGNVVVQRRSNGQLVDEVYDVTFAFVYHAFHEGRRIVTE
ncbi:MAG: hypothetical protein COW30_14775 [Rhodospirillales bacterium CG15_BIG_FIL_POST_REV_8_21_14_020_66_15]|nr:MAG: hypothetical protein COW30_14775 [Rhodospirillales bacterium CG15_BIG_FIL_POST_REV_8_21_14_020_66_15]